MTNELETAFEADQTEPLNEVDRHDEYSAGLIDFAEAYSQVQDHEAAKEEGTDEPALLSEEDFDAELSSIVGEMEAAGMSEQGILAAFQDAEDEHRDEQLIDQLRADGLSDEEIHATLDQYDEALEAEGQEAELIELDEPKPDSIHAVHELFGEDAELSQEFLKKCEFLFEGALQSRVNLLKEDLKAESLMEAIEHVAKYADYLADHVQDQLM